jgi:hypothetical protein
MSDLQEVISAIFLESVQIKGLSETQSLDGLRRIREHARNLIMLVDNNERKLDSGTGKKRKELAASVPLASSLPSKEPVMTGTMKKIQVDNLFAARGTSEVAIKAVLSTPVPVSELSTQTLEGHLTGSRFSELDILPNTKRALAEVLKYDRMTVVQQQSLPVILQGRDVLVKARTGTGKTLGFLVPAINNLMTLLTTSRVKEGGIRPSILVMSPTRELALQIAAEATKLCSFHPLGIATLVGGTNIEGDKRTLYGGRGVQIVVGTPGRLNDHLENDKRFRDLCAGMLVLVLVCLIVIDLHESSIIIVMLTRTRQTACSTWVLREISTRFFNASIAIVAHSRRYPGVRRRCSSRPRSAKTSRRLRGQVSSPATASSTRWATTRIRRTAMSRSFY